MEVFLMLNGRELRASVPDAEAIIIGVAAGECTRERLASWLTDHIVPREGN
jgi:death-on-curing protein